MGAPLPRQQVQPSEELGGLGVDNVIPRGDARVAVRLDLDQTVGVELRNGLSDGRT